MSALTPNARDDQGAGKSHTMKQLASRGLFPLGSYVIVDPDEIRQHFPEYHLYAEQSPKTDRANGPRHSPKALENNGPGAPVHCFEIPPPEASDSQAPTSGGPARHTLATGAAPGAGHPQTVGRRGRKAPLRKRRERLSVYRSGP